MLRLGVVVATDGLTRSFGHTFIVPGVAAGMFWTAWAVSRNFCSVCFIPCVDSGIELNSSTKLAAGQDREVELAFSFAYISV